MILSTAYALILGLSSFSAEATPTSGWSAEAAIVRPSSPVSLAAGDALGMALMESNHDNMPPVLAARLRIASQPMVAWAVMPGEQHFAFGH
jgi:hypothetical protein